MFETPVGFVGTGAMGSAIAQRLLEVGYEIVVHNRTRANASSVEEAGASWAGSPAEVAERCSIVVTCLRDSVAVDSIYRGTAGLLSTAETGHIFVEHGTFAPAAAEVIEAAASDRGAGFLAIPVSGGPVGAASGQLTAMAGGDESTLRRARALLNAYAAHITHVGSVTHGLTLKLVNQHLVTIHLAAAAEALALAERSGLSRAVAAPILMQGWAASAMLERTARQLDTESLTGTGVTIDGLIEVQQLVSQKLRETCSSSSIFDPARTLFVKAADRGLGENDPALLLKILDLPALDPAQWNGGKQS